MALSMSTVNKSYNKPCPLARDKKINLDLTNNRNA